MMTRAKRKAIDELLPIGLTCMPAQVLFDEGIVDPNGVEVFERDDTIGKSVRARRRFEQGEYVCSYGGRVLFGSDAQRISRYLMLLLDTNAWLDGDPDVYPFETRNHAGSYVNDATPCHGGNNNAIYSFMWFRYKIDDELTVRVPAVLLKALRRIEAGEELWVSYGDLYWQKHEQLYGHLVECE